MRRVLLWLLPFAAAYTQPPDVTSSVARMASAVRDNVRRLPNYTCTTTIERSLRDPKTLKLIPTDRIRLEVALVGNRELYAWPGSRNFEERPIRDLVPGGAIGTGEFASFLESVVLSGAARIEYAGLEQLDGRPVHHFTYSMPRALSSYEIRFLHTAGIVGYDGSIWSDAGNLDPRRLEIIIRDIPAGLPLTAGRHVIDYARQNVAGGQFLLPSTVDSSFTVEGRELDNHTSFSDCREFRVESAISFGERLAEAPAAPPAPAALPDNILIDSALETEVDSARVAIGDPFVAQVTNAVHHDGEILVPKGARIHGRIVAIQRTDHPYPCVELVLRADWIEFGGREGKLVAEQALRSRPERPAQRTAMLGQVTQMPDSACRLPTVTGAAMLFVHSDRFHLPDGFPITWRTVNATKLGP
jgi:hypothetical protein